MGIEITTHKNENKMTLLVCGRTIPDNIQKKFKSTYVIDNIECETFITKLDIFTVTYCKIKDEDNQKIVDCSSILYSHKIIILYFSDRNDDSNRDLDLLEKLSNKNEKLHPFIIFLTGYQKDRYINYIKQLENYFDPLNIIVVQIIMIMN